MIQPPLQPSNDELGLRTKDQGLREEAAMEGVDHLGLVTPNAHPDLGKVLKRTRMFPRGAITEKAWVFQ